MCALQRIDDFLAFFVYCKAIKLWLGYEIL